MSATTIEWTDRVWNPVRGCSLVSAGCANCYAMKQAHRFSGMGRPYENLTEIGPKGPRWTGNILLVPEELKAPLTWKKPCRVFVNSMSDLFHEDVPDSFIDQVMRAMANTKRHTYQVLTKRPARMLAYLSGWWNRCYQSFETGESIPVTPCPHIWFGVSVENQDAADERIPLLLQTPAAVRFISAEPLLGTVDLKPHLWSVSSATCRHETRRTCGLPMLDWTIVGGESGPGARPCDVAWIRSITDQCKAAGVSCFVKQLGGYVVDRNDAGFEGDEPTAWPMDTDVSDRDNQWDYQGAKIRIRLKDRKGGDWNEWPDDLRVREFPTKGARDE